MDRKDIAHNEPGRVEESEHGKSSLKHIYTKPYRPQTNGKIEAFWRIIKKEFFYPHSFDSKEDIMMNLSNFLFEFNHLRKYGGLNYETPFDKLQKVTELLS